jgi:PIN domain nuclease of toxin-antitoxin system
LKLLLDTHAVIWSVKEDLLPKLSARAHDAIRDPAHDILISAASAWEIATKYRLGRLVDVDDIVRGWGAVLRGLAAEDVAVNSGHALRAGSYEVAHNDPFDRILAAQSEIEGATLVTADPAMHQFGVDILW